MSATIESLPGRIPGCISERLDGSERCGSAGVPTRTGDSQRCTPQAKACGYETWRTRASAVRQQLGAACWILAVACGAVLAAPGAGALYENDFQGAALNKIPDDFLILDGQFTVGQEGTNRFLELPGAPLDTFGVLFGPSQKDNVAVTARIFGTAQGRRFPVFGVSLGGAAGYRLQVAPAKKAVELFKGDQLVTSTPYAWNSERWTRFRLDLRQAEPGGCTVSGKVWQDGAVEPAAWTVVAREQPEPAPGRPGLWGSPFSGTPMRFDDLRVSVATEKP